MHQPMNNNNLTIDEQMRLLPNEYNTYIIKKER